MEKINLMRELRLVMSSRCCSEPEPEIISGGVMNCSLTIEGFVACEKSSTLLKEGLLSY